METPPADTPSNTAAWQPEPGSPLDVRSAPYTAPGENEIVIRNAAVAVNPVDWILQDDAVFDWIKYPLVLGSDVAGEVVEVGRQVSRFSPGDRVLGQATGAMQNRPAGGAFQAYTVVQAHMATRLPDEMDYAVPPCYRWGWARPRAACSKTTNSVSTIPRPTPSRRGSCCSSGEARRASGATRSSSPSPPATRSWRRPRPGTPTC